MNQAQEISQLTGLNRKKIITGTYHSPCGTLILGTFGDRLCMCDWQTSAKHTRTTDRLHRLLDADLEQGSAALIDLAARQLDEYFAGKRQSFDVPLLPVGTDFQLEVWQALLGIPYGTTATYADMARLVGNTDAVRAVANAVGANALSIFMACHRVIGRGGKLTGYAGGMAAKKWLLELERTNS